MGKKKISVDSIPINIVDIEGQYYVNITDIAKRKGDRPDIVISAWMRTRTTLNFLYTWENFNNKQFKPYKSGKYKGFESVMMEFIDPGFSMYPTKWIDYTNAKGLVVKRGRYGGSFAHEMIALEFASYISAEFKFYMIDEFKRLKTDEGKSLGAPWSIRREMAKINTAILDQAIRERLVPPQLAFTKKEQAFFASEKDMINLIVFGMTAREWKKSNPIKKGNQRDHATTDELTVIANLESLDARLLKWDCERPLREDILMQTAIDQFSILGNNKAAKRLQANLDKQDGLLE